MITQEETGCVDVGGSHENISLTHTTMWPSSRSRTLTFHLICNNSFWQHRLSGTQHHTQHFFFSFFFCSFPPFLRRQYQQQTQRNTVMTSVVRQVSQLCLHVDHVSTSKSSLLAAFSKRKDVELISGEAPARTSYLRYDLHACFYPMIVDQYMSHQ